MKKNIKSFNSERTTFYYIFKDFIYPALIFLLGLIGGYYISVYSMKKQQEISQKESKSIIINMLYSLIEEIDYNSKIMEADIKDWESDKDHLGPTIRFYSIAAWDASKIVVLSNSLLEPKFKFLISWYYNWITNLNTARTVLDQTLMSGFQILATEETKAYTKHWKIVKELKRGYMSKVSEVNNEWTPHLKLLMKKKIEVLQGNLILKDYLDYLERIVL